jgi:iron complex outermembrane receptor protein
MTVGMKVDGRFSIVPPRRLRRFIMLSGIVVTAPAWSSPPSQDNADLADLSIEQLMDESVTSVAKHDQKLGDAAAAISVLSNDDLRRSGATTIAAALRLVPGLDVAGANSNQWAISARGFNNVYANKLLVLVDGRAVYSSIFAGVYWQLQHMMLEDIDRIEVIRGPGATVWGANAVNGVINIVTRSAVDSQGVLAYAGGGDAHEALAGLRYGGKAGENTYYRLFSGYRRDADYPLANGLPADDSWDALEGGLRVDHYPQTNTHLTWQAEATSSAFDTNTSATSNVNTLGRWTGVLSERSEFEVQAYYDRNSLSEAGVHGEIETLDFTLQHTFGLGSRNDVIWGTGYRHIAHKIASMSPVFRIRDSAFGLQLFNVFVQDEFKLVPDRLTLTAGLKVEHNDYTGFELQPSVSATFKPAAEQTLWAAVSRAVRTPGALEGRDLFAIIVAAPFAAPGGLYIPTLVGNTELDSEILWAYEAGYRIQATRQLNLDIATFYNDYSKLINYGGVQGLIPGTPVGTAVIAWGNLIDGRTYGGEIVVTASPTDAWRITASYSLLVPQLHGAAVAAVVENSSPRHQASLRSSSDFAERASIDAQLRYVGAIESAPSYLTADLRLMYQLTRALQLSLVGQNLLEGRHPEQASVQGVVIAEVPRGIYAKLTGRF